MTARSVIFVYCLLAMLAAMAGVFVVARSAQAQGKALAAATDRFRAAQYAARLLDETRDELLQTQRDSRLNATPADAIALSARLQELQGDFDAAARAAQVAEAEAARLDAQRRRLLLLLVPLIAILLLHVVGALYFWPRRQSV